ncbi:MAG: hypothetical protein CMB64_01175 [Euryarchaeota archaeon]|nr:hypothetical protein [Euryarchaeota archaeon]|tara:strand:- start:210 stop:428 length:219 start_codon:yes stop_codon:yes gene_type:complete
MVAPENREKLLIIWLILSSFGIMFAVLSWMQEAKLIPSSEEMGLWKGVLALLTGFVLYWSIAYNITGGPGDK